MTTAELTFESTSRFLDGEPRLHYHEAGEGRPLVLLHGSGPGVSGWSNFRGNLPVFAQHFRTVVADMVGFGKSGLPELDRAYPRIAADHVVRLLDALAIDKTSLLGNSMGGYVALEFALAYPDRVEKIIGMGPGGLAANVLGPEQSEGARRLSEFMMSPSKEGMERWVDTMVANKAVVDDALIEERLANALAPGAIQAAISIFMSLAQHPEEFPSTPASRPSKRPCW